jgi:hypothetical protein
MVSFFDNRNLCVDPLMHKQQLGTENNVGHLSVDEQTEMRSVSPSGLVHGSPMAFVQLHQMTVAHPQRTQDIDTVQTVVSSFTSQLILPFTKSAGIVHYGRNK